MRRVVLLCGLVACTASAELLAQDLSAAEVKDVRSEIERLHGHEQEAFASGDCEAVASFYAEDVTFFANGRAVPSVDALVNLCGRIPRPFEQHTAMRNEVRVLSEDAAQSVQVIEFAPRHEGDDLRREVVTKVWSKGPEGWRIVHFHSSISAIPTRPSSMSLEVERQSVEQALLRINRDIMESMILENDATALLRHAHDEFLVVAPGGRIEDREQAAAGAQSFAARGVSIAEEQVTLVDNTAVVVGRLEIDGEMRPVGQLPPMKFMAVFVRQGSEWKLLSRALTPCLPMAIDRGFC